MLNSEIITLVHWEGNTLGGQWYKIVIIKNKNTHRAAGQISCQFTGNSLGAFYGRWSRTTVNDALKCLINIW